MYATFKDKDFNFPDSYAALLSRVGNKSSAWRVQKSEQVNYYVTNPPSEYSISLNNIGSFNATQGKIFTCLKPYQNGVLAPIGGVSEFSIAFSIISGAEGTIGVAESGAFNPSGNLGSDGEKLSCSGTYETTTGIYKDIILVNSSVIETSFQLVDPALLVFNLLSAKSVNKCQH